MRIFDPNKFEAERKRINDMAKEIAVLFVFESDSSPGKVYQTLQYVDGTTSCECPGWKFKRKTTATSDRTCKHTRFIEAGLADQHAVKTVRYKELVRTTGRRPVAMTPELQPRPGSRVFDLD